MNTIQNTKPLSTFDFKFFSNIDTYHVIKIWLNTGNTVFEISKPYCI